MTEIEIDEVSLPSKRSDHLWGCSIQVPLIGSGDAPFWIHVGGYVSGRYRQAAAVEFIDADNVVRVAAVRISRPDVAMYRPGERGVELCGFYTLVDARKLSPEFDLELRAVLDDGSRVPIGSIRGRHRYHLPESQKPAQDSSPAQGGPAPASAEEPSSVEEPSIPSISDDLKGLILARLNDHGAEPSAAPDSDGSHPLLDGEAALDDAETSLLDGIDFAGKTVLELRAGTGERARAARARGAALVDALEPDPVPAGLARLLTAYHHTSRVFFHQDDNPLQNADGHEYDIVLATGGFDLVRDRLEVIASITRGILVTELPASDPERAAALESVRARFPVHELIELSAGSGAPAASRFFFVGATDESRLRSALLGRDGVTAPASG